MLERVHSGDGVLAYSGHQTGRDEILSLAREDLLRRGRHHLEVDDVLSPRRGLVVAAWWAGAEVGFCGPDHPTASAVTVVNLPGGML